jgi:uncharacterized ParB-like nuclease family protein
MTLTDAFARLRQRLEQLRDGNDRHDSVEPTIRVYREVLDHHEHNLTRQAVKTLVQHEKNTRQLYGSSRCLFTEQELAALGKLGAGVKPASALAKPTPPPDQPQDVPLTAIRIDGDTQARVALDAEVVTQFHERMSAGDAFPPLDVLHDGSAYWLWDGFHRLHAHRLRGAQAVPCRVRQGTVEEARWLAAGSNREHDRSGQRRKNQDKRRAVLMALAARPDASDPVVAEHCGVSAEMVRQHRASLPTVGSQPAARVGRDGRTIDTSRIGRKKEQPAPPKPAREVVIGEPEPRPDVVVEEDDPLSSPPPVPDFPYSTMLTNWANRVLSAHLIISHDHDSLASMLAERGKWNRKEVVNFLLPKIKSIREILERYEKEIGEAFPEPEEPAARKPRRKP